MLCDSYDERDINLRMLEEYLTVIGWYCDAELTSELGWVHHWTDDNDKWMHVVTNVYREDEYDAVHGMIGYVADVLNRSHDDVCREVLQYRFNAILFALTEAYLKNKGAVSKITNPPVWADFGRETNDLGNVWHYGGKAITVPFSDSFKSYEESLDDVVLAIAQVENRSAMEVKNDILSNVEGKWHERKYFSS